MRERVKRWLWIDILALLVVVGVPAGAVLALTSGDEGEKPTPFPTAAITQEPSPSPTATRPGDPKVLHAGNWPTYGYDMARTRCNPNVDLRPPFRLKWTFKPRDLLEFPPSIDDGRLYLCAGHGYVYCLDAATGKRVWRYASHGKFASTPTIDGDEVYVSSFAGKLIVLDKYSGKRRWQFTGCAVTESSPLVWRRRVFFGDRNGDLWALSTRTHKVVWRYHTGGKITGAPAMLNERIVVGSYDGVVYCLNYNGGLVWKTSTSGALGVTDPFYGTPALAYNTVYLGSIGRHVFAFDLTNGGTRWKTATGAWVYASPAVWKGLVLIGCFDTWFYALDAANGHIVWRFNARGKISGSPTVINGVVYFSTLNWKTFACDARTGKLLWTWRDGKYTPVTADKERLYLCGALKLYCLVPKK